MLCHRTRLLQSFVLFTCLLLLSSCSSLPGKVTSVTTHQAGYATAQDPAKQNVYLYFIHGLDPFDIADLAGLERHFRDLGYYHTRLLQFYESDEIIEDIRQVKAFNPDARIMILGFSAGTLTTSSVINTLHHKHQIDVDLVVYTAGIALMDTEEARPTYIGKIIHILDGGMVLPGVELTGADNYRFEDVWHFGTPSHANTMGIIEAELKAGILARQ